MGWLGTFLQKLIKGAIGAPPIQLTFIPSVSSDGIPGIGIPIVADECYVELYLESMRLKEARRFATRFQGVAYSFVSLAREGDENAQLTAVSKPDKLAELDKNSLDKVITVSKQMMGPTAYRGGPFSLEFGLFSIKAGNLLTPIIDFITKVSSTAGITSVDAVKPFVPLITQGMDMIAGQTNDTALEVGVDTDMNLTKSCVSAIIAKPEGSVDPKKLSLAEDFRLMLNGNPLDCGYAVFSIRYSKQKSDFGAIPDLKQKYAALQTAILAGKMKDAEDALTVFRLAAIASPDLITSDAHRLIDLATKKYKDAFTPGFVTSKSLKIESLSEIGLYNPQSAIVN